MTASPRPPRLLRLLVRSRLRSSADDRDAIEADLEELYAARREARGRVYALSAYVRDAVSLWRPVRPRLGAAAFDGGRTATGVRVRAITRGAAFWDMAQDIRYAMRRLRRRPTPTLAAIATLALAVGANIAIFNLIDRVVLHPLDVPNVSDLVTAQRTYVSRGVSYRRSTMDWEQVDRVRELATLPDVAVSTATLDRASRRLVLSRNGHDAPDVVDGRFVSDSFFRVLGLAPVLGRDFQAADDAGGGASVVILGETFWRTRFGAARDAVGQPIQINGVPAVIIGVASASFTGTELGTGSPAVFLPLMAGAARDQYRGADRWPRHVVHVPTRRVRAGRPVSCLSALAVFHHRPREGRRSRPGSSGIHDGIRAGVVDGSAR